MPRLIIDKAHAGTQVFELAANHPVSIGRAKSCALVLDDVSVSRTHAVIRSTQDGVLEIVDLDSSNGLKVNGRVVKEAKLRPNDEISIGAYTLRFEEPDVRHVATQNTAKLPPRVMQELDARAYSGSFLPVMPIASATSESGVAERLRELERENRLLTILYRVSRVLSQMDSVEEVAERVLDLVLEIEGAQRGYAMLLDEESMRQTDFKNGEYGFRPAVIRYRRPPGDLERKPMPNLIISKTIVRNVMQAGNPLLITDAKDDPRLSISESVVISGIQSAMCAPLAARERRYGLLYVDNLSRRAIFSMDELNVFAMIAAQAGLVIDSFYSNVAPVKP